MGVPKIHKEGRPMREIVDGNGGILKEIDRHISKILKKYVGLSEYYIKNSKDFVDKAKDMKVEEDEELVSYDVYT